MQQNKISILSTRPLPQALVDEAAEQNIIIDLLSFIETEPIQSVEVQQEIEQALLRYAVVIFTSMNAVEAVAAYMQSTTPDWLIYCIGQTTLRLVEKYFGEASIGGTANNATELAELVARDAPANELIFFCGDQRRNELPDILRGHDMEVLEITVYHTISTPHAIDKKYNGILFFSPTAAESFFSKNKASTNTILFAIGNTTTDTLKKHSTATVITAGTPGKDSLVEKVINYFVNEER
ncbi:MAG: uroporphyrinogen-III synthase [Bacteroidota bacterium]